MRTWCALAFFLIVGLPHVANAFPTTSHYAVSTSGLENNARLRDVWGPEASSDWITFQRPMAWERDFWSSPKSFDLSLGSISSKQFLHYQRLKIAEDLTDRLQAQILYLSERDFEMDRVTTPLELKYAVTPRWAISVFGVPSLYKSENDAGVSLFWMPSHAWEYRVSALYGDYDRNTRNLNSDRWRERPFGGTASAKWLSTEDDSFFYLEGHWEPRSELEENGQRVRALNYDSFLTYGARALGNGRQVAWRILYDHAEEHDDTTGKVFARRRALHQVEYEFWGGPHRIRPGLNYFYREARENQEQWIYREILPSLWFHLPAKYQDWSLGYDATIFQQAHNQDVDRNLEHRLNVKWLHSFSKRAELALLFTFDLDRFGTGETWEGGAGQFRMVF